MAEHQYCRFPSNSWQPISQNKHTVFGDKTVCQTATQPEIHCAKNKNKNHYSTGASTFALMQPPPCWSSQRWPPAGPSASGSLADGNGRE